MIMNLYITRKCLIVPAADSDNSEQPNNTGFNYGVANLKETVNILGHLFLNLLERDPNNRLIKFRGLSFTHRKKLMLEMRMACCCDIRMVYSYRPSGIYEIEKVTRSTYSTANAPCTLMIAWS